MQSKKELIEINDSIVENKRTVSNKENMPSFARKESYFGISEGKVDDPHGGRGYQEVIFHKAIPENERKGDLM